MIARILELLEEKGVSQKQLATAIGVSTGNVSDWKVGRAKPSIEVLGRIADFFGVSVDYLIGRTDVKNVDDLIMIYNVGIDRWMQERIFSTDEKTILKENLRELLLRYKALINTLVRYMYSDGRKGLVSSGASCEELSMSTSSALHRQLRDLICWVASFPYDFNKQAKMEGEDATALSRSLYEMVGVLPEGMDLDKMRLSDDEHDLLSMWSLLDKDGRRIVLGTATEQKQRVISEQGDKAGASA